MFLLLDISFGLFIMKHFLLFIVHSQNMNNPSNHCETETVKSGASAAPVSLRRNSKARRPPGCCRSLIHHYYHKSYILWSDMKSASHSPGWSLFSKRRGLQIGLIEVKEEGRTGFSKGWQGCSKGFPEGKALPVVLPDSFTPIYLLFPIGFLLALQKSIDGSILTLPRLPSIFSHQNSSVGE